MIKLKLTMTAPKFEAGKYTLALERELFVQMKQAARAFLEAAIVHVPIDTGQARGTFLPLGRFLNRVVPIEGNTPKPNKNPETGASNKNKQVFQFVADAKGQYFEIDSKLFYFWFNDFYTNELRGTPWKSLEEGRKAFLLYMKNVAPSRLPRLKHFITRESVNYNSRFE